MNTVLTWGIQLFDAIDHMYQRHKLVHRDIKPDNIFVTNEYQLKIGDFGVVKVVGDGTDKGTFIGTPRYISPPEMKEDGVPRNAYEQVKEADVFNSHRNDVYSLGLVMWEIIERRNIFTNYEAYGVFDRYQLLIDIALKRITEIEPPECQAEIQSIISRCTNFQRILRPPTSEVLDFLKQTQKENEFISSLDFMPTEDKDQKELMKPIGFDYRKEGVMVGSEERKYEKRFDGKRWDIQYGFLGLTNINRTMRDKLRTLNSAERDNFYKKAPNIVSRLKERTQRSKDARYVIPVLMGLEQEKDNLHERNLYEIFELFVLGDFRRQLQVEIYAFASLKSHEEIWISSFENWEGCENQINILKEIKREKYTTNFYFRCFISQLTGEGWIHIEKVQFELRPTHKERNMFVSADFRLVKVMPGQWVDHPKAKNWSYIVVKAGQWVDNPKTEFRSYKVENEDNKHEMLYFSHYKQIPLERIIEAFEKQQEKMENIIKLYLKHLIPIEDSEKNNVPFNIQSLLDESSKYERFYGPHPFPHYIFQLRNPPRPICQKNHSGECPIDGLRKVRRCSGLPKELHIPVCGEITKNEILFLDSYLECIDRHRGLAFLHMKRPFLFLCCQNLLDIPFLILLDHPNNYENWESIPGLDFKWKLPHIDVGVLREYFQESKFNEVYALFKCEEHTPYIRLIDYQGNPKTEWLEFKKVPNSAFYSQFTKQEEATISS